MSSGKVMHVFFEVSMSNGHNGLGRILKKSKSDIEKDQYALFINKDWCACKLLTAEGVLLHLKRPRNQPIEPKTLPFLPYCISGTKLNYTQALAAVIQEKFEEEFVN